MAEAKKVMIQCVCKNVHLGNGVVLKAKKNSQGNWKDGDIAEVSPEIAKLLVKSEQVEIVK